MIEYRKKQKDNNTIVKSKNLSDITNAIITVYHNSFRAVRRPGIQSSRAMDFTKKNFFMYNLY